MNTEQLKAVAMAATPGPWKANRTDVFCGRLRVCHQVSAGQQLGLMAQQEKAEANAQHIAAANPSTILALLECVDALRDMLKQFTKTPSTLKDSQARGKGHAALQQLEAL